MANYIDPDHYDRVMLKCKLDDKLSDEAINLFTVHAREVSTTMNSMFKREDDRKDCIAYATSDFYKYWRSYKINPICRAEMTRLFLDGETFSINIDGDITTFTAKEFVTKEDQFKIVVGKNLTVSINKTLDNLNDRINQLQHPMFESYLHKVTRRINVIDKSCSRDSKNFIIINKKIGEKISKIDFSNTIGDTALNFGNPPPAFNYLTTVATNGMKKAIKKMYPKVQRKMVNFSEINASNGGLFNT